MGEFGFSTELSVRFAETDAQGIAHNAAYLVWYEVARIDFLARFGGGYSEIRAEGMEALTIEAHVRYVDKLRDDDLPGEPGDSGHSWLGLMKLDFVTMVKALRGDASPLLAVPTSLVRDRAVYPQ